jgi:hypothetical protein
MCDLQQRADGCEIPRHTSERRRECAVGAGAAQPNEAWLLHSRRHRHGPCELCSSSAAHIDLISQSSGERRRCGRRCGTLSREQEARTPLRRGCRRRSGAAAAAAPRFQEPLRARRVLPCRRRGCVRGISRSCTTLTEGAPAALLGRACACCSRCADSCGPTSTRAISALTAQVPLRLRLAEPVRPRWAVLRHLGPVPPRMRPRSLSPVPRPGLG